MAQLAEPPKELKACNFHVFESLQSESTRHGFVNRLAFFVRVATRGGPIFVSTMLKT